MRSRKLRLIALLLVFAMTAMALAACGSKSSSSSSSSATQATKDDSTKAPDNSETKPEETKPEDKPSNPGGNDSLDLESMTALELSKIMGKGINLGNTMESGDRNKLGTEAAIKLYETNWRQPVTTEAMIKGMKDAGFDTIRIPVAWTCAINYDKDDYTIRKEFMDRIDEIVNYAIKADMFVIVNDHWDNQWWGRFGDEDASVREVAWKLYEEMWKQIAEHFKDYDEHLIFESANEELGNRLNDNWRDTSGPNTGVLTKDECYDTVNKINQKFVDVVRAAGGHNEHRFLLLAGYNTDVTMTCDEKYKLPNDTAKSKLFVSVHYYDPSGYCLDNGSGSWGMKPQYQSMNTMLNKLTKFTDEGYGVIIGEWGVLHKASEYADSIREGALEYMENFLDNCDYYGYVPVLWDCNGAYSKEDCAIRNKDIAKIFKAHSYAVISEYDEEEYKAKVKKDIDKAEADAPEYVVEDGTAWIMFNASDWGTVYAVGDSHPADKTGGIVVEEPIVKEAGTYTTTIDFSGTQAGSANSTAFCALAIYKGEELNPGYVIKITEMLVNGEPFEFAQNYYTTSDDKVTTRINLYNAWVDHDNDTLLLKNFPENGRTVGGLTLEECSPMVVDPVALGKAVKSISITFEYGPAE